MSKFYLTTPLYYVNSRPHIGHSYTNIASDALARFRRLTLGRENVLFLTGTDEHGQKIDKAAQAAGMTPEDFTDKISGTFRELWKTLNIDYDDFIRTTEPRHVQAVQEVWRRLDKKGELYKGAYSGWYCTPDETFWTEGQVLGEGGKTLCPDCRRPVEKIEEENYFLKLSKHQRWLIDTIRKGEEIVILPETRRNEVLGFLENNDLQDLCISRPKSRLAWGIPSPVSDAHVTYVWFDALINYVSATGFGADEAKMKRWWPADVHIIGKDILRHHAVYWTILLKALDLPLPKMIFAHGWWVQGGEKMSKSRGNVIDPLDVSKKYGVDAYRYFLLREAPFGEDGTFSEEAFILRFNTDLANDLGNLLNRTLTMCEKYFGGQVPPDASPECLDLRKLADPLPEKLEKLMDRLAFSEALAEIWAVVNQANKYIETQAPWKLAKAGDQETLKLTIAGLVELLRVVAVAVSPFMPQTSEAVWTQLGLSGKPSDVSFRGSLWGHFKKGGRIAKGAPLFPRIETEKT